MEFRFDDSSILEQGKNPENDSNNYMIISKPSNVNDKDIEKVIKIIDESGTEKSLTYDQFVDIFDEQGLEGFIL